MNTLKRIVLMFAAAIALAAPIGIVLEASPQSATTAEASGVHYGQGRVYWNGSYCYATTFNGARPTVPSNWWACYATRTYGTANYVNIYGTKVSNGVTFYWTNLHAHQ